MHPGIDARGCTYWSAFDNFEWMMGYKMRFGLIAVDRAMRRRTICPAPGTSVPYRWCWL